MTKQGSFRRRNYFIKKGLQSRFIFGFSLTVAIGFLTSWILVYYLVDKRLAQALYRSHIKIGTTGEIIGDILLKVNLIAVPLLIISVIIVGLFIVNRVTIPLTGFKEALEDFGKGNLTPKVLKDIPAELSMAYNKMVGYLAKIFASVTARVDELEQKIQELEHTADEKPLSQQKVENICKSIAEERKAIEQELSIFKT